MNVICMNEKLEKLGEQGIMFSWCFCFNDYLTLTRTVNCCSLLIWTQVVIYTCSECKALLNQKESICFLDCRGGWLPCTGWWWLQLISFRIGKDKSSFLKASFGVAEVSRSDNNGTRQLTLSKKHGNLCYMLLIYVSL